MSFFDVSPLFSIPLLAPFCLFCFSFTFSLFLCKVSVGDFFGALKKFMYCSCIEVLFL